MKPRHLRLKPNQQILEEASGWFVDFRVGDIDASAREAFHEWLRRSPEHVQAYMDIAGTYAELPAPGAGGELDVESLIARARVVPDANVFTLDLQSAAVTTKFTPPERAGARRTGTQSQRPY